MRYFVVFLFLTLSLPSFAQEQKEESTRVNATIINDNTLLPIENVTVININKV